MTPLIRNVFSASPDIRYVATYLDGILASSQRPELEDASGSESDKYEELIVNPTLLKLVMQRGDIDCGGADWVVIRYGNFYELVVPVANGHLSVGIELSGNPLRLVDKVLSAYSQSLS